MVAVANAFMERIILSLLPFFLAATPDPDEARAAIVGAIASYGARTQHDITETAQILALGFCTVDSLAESAGSGMSVTRRLRLRGNATALVRSKKICQQALSNSRYTSASLYTEVAEPTQPDQARAEVQPAALNPLFQRARDRGQQQENPVAMTLPEPTAPSVAPTTPPATPSRAPSPIVTVSGQAAVPQTDQEMNALLRAGVMSQMVSNLVQESGHASA